MARFERLLDRVGAKCTPTTMARYRQFIEGDLAQIEVVAAHGALRLDTAVGGPRVTFAFTHDGKVESILARRTIQASAVATQGSQTDGMDLSQDDDDRFVDASNCDRAAWHRFVSLYRDSARLFCEQIIW